MMKQLAFAIFSVALSVAGAVEIDPSLVPGINGGVSALGTYSSRALEDDARTALKPGVNKDVSASGNNADRKHRSYSANQTGISRRSRMPCRAGAFPTTGLPVQSHRITLSHHPGWRE